ncbi:hypothetical protein CALVIDRAFT_555143 [Calocera viscosa TUFC12733]|uniref:F-box domain-containing protein n=1 Tax=Calocera viscosa (strain TUFC12733) TaxID=1330018 RepID=A0A167M6N7_CALVF|nr:hypothetical protein CALVIDRAFT_555143 [Calocera viscosa TUFC12733]
MDDLPLELVRAILREATAVPGAFDYPTANFEAHDKTVDGLIEASFKTKLALSLVSKTVNQLNEEFLYEIVHVRKLEHIRPLVLLLRSDADRRIPRGWYCRRLEVTLVPWDVRHDWNDGRHTLWGLAPCCPQAIDLRITIGHPPRRGGYSLGAYRTPYAVSTTLLQTITSLQGPKLRYLALQRRVRIPFSLASQLLARLPVLEGFTFHGLRRVKRPVAWTIASPTPVSLLGVDVPEEVTDDSIFEEEDEYGSGHLSSIVDSDNGAQDAIHIELTAEHHEYKAAIKSSKWPGHPMEVLLPRLRILRCTNFGPAVSTWKVPALEKLVIGTHGYESAADICDTLVHWLKPQAGSITYFTYDGGPALDIWSIVPLFRHMTWLQFPINGLLEDSRLSTAHSTLESIVLVREWSNRAQSMVTACLVKLAEQVEAGSLPALRDVCLLDTKGTSPDLDELVVRFRGFNVKLYVHVTFVYPA